MLLVACGSSNSQVGINIFLFGPQISRTNTVI